MATRTKIAITFAAIALIEVFSLPMSAIGTTLADGMMFETAYAADNIDNDLGIEPADEGNSAVAYQASNPDGSASFDQQLSLLVAAVEPQKVGLSAYDLQQLKALDSAYNQLLAYDIKHPGALEAYNNASPQDRALPAEVLKNLGLTDQPKTDIRVIKTLNYLTSSTALNGGGIEWLRVPSVANGYQNEATSYNKDIRDGEDTTTSPHAEGKGIQVSEINYLKGTRFIYQVDVPKNQTDQTLDPSKIDYSTATLVDKQKLGKVPVQVGWQTASASGTAANPTGTTMNQSLYNLGSKQLLGDMTENGAMCDLSNVTAADNTISLINGIGTQCTKEQLGNQNLSLGGNFFTNGLATGQNIYADSLTGITANGISAGDPTKGTNAFYMAGLANLEKTLGFSCSTFADSPEKLSNPDSFALAVGQCVAASEMFGGTGKTNYFTQATTGNADSFAMAVGRTYLEGLLGYTFSSLIPGVAVSTMQNNDVIAYQRLFGTDYEYNLARFIYSSFDGNVNKSAGDEFAKLKANPASTPDAFLLALGKMKIAMTRDMYSSIDAAYGLSIGRTEADLTANPNDRFNRMVNGDQQALREVAYSRLASIATPETSQQDAVYQFLSTKTMPTDSTGQPIVDTGGIESRLQLRPGDFKAIVMDGQGWGVLQRQGLFSYARNLSGQGQALANQLQPIYTGEFLKTSLESLKSQGQSLVNMYQAQLQQLPNQMLGGVVGTLQSQLNAINQSVYNDINIRLQQDQSTNPFDQQLRNIQGSLGILATYSSYGPDSVRQPLSSLAMTANNTISQIYSPGVQLINFSQWSGGGAVSQSFVNNVIASQNGFTTMNWDVTSTGLQAMYGTLYGNVVNPLNSAFQNATSFVSNIQNLLQSAGYAINKLDPSNIKVTIDEKGMYNFIINDLVAGTPGQQWAQEIGLGLKFAFRKDYQPTEADVRSLWNGTSMRVATMLGANQADIAFGLQAASPFLDLALGKTSFELAAGNSALQTAQQYLYGFTNQIDLGNPTLNSAMQIVMEEGIGYAHNSMQNAQSFFNMNDKDIALTTMGIVPADVQALRTSDPEEYTRRMGMIYQDFQQNPAKYREQIVTTAAAKGLPPEFADFVSGNISGSDLAQLYALNFPSTGTSTDRERSLALALSGNDANSAHFADNLELAKKMLPMLDPSNVNADGTYKSEAELRQLLTDSYINQIGDRTGSGKDVLDATTNRLQYRLTDLGLSAIDDQIEALTGVSGVLRTFYRTNNPSEAAMRMGWNALTKYVNFPPELTELMGYFGGDPMNIAKTFSQGRAGTAFAAYSASQLYKITGDAGVSIGLRDFMIAQFGPSVSEMNTLNVMATAEVATLRQQSDEKIDAALANAPDTASPLNPDITASRNTLMAASLKSDAAAYLPTVKERAQSRIEATRTMATKNFQYSMMDYAATLSIRSASGNQSISMAGLTRTMINGTPTQQAAFMLNILNAFTKDEMTQYLGDAVAAYDIYSYIHEITQPIIVTDNSAIDGGIANDLGPSTTLQSGSLPGTVQIPVAAFNRIDMRLSQALGWQVPAGFSQAMVSFARSGFDFNGKVGNLPSMKDILTSVTLQSYVGTWVDKLVGLPQGTSFTMYQMAVQYQVALAAYQQAQLLQTLAISQSMGASLASGAAVSVELGKQFGASVGGLASSNTLQAITAGSAAGGAAATTGDLLGGIGGGQTADLVTTTGAASVKQATAQVTAAAAKMAAITTTAINLALNMAFSKTFTQLDESLGLPTGTASSIIGAGIAIGISYGFAAAAGGATLAGWTAIGALGGPLGVAMLAGGLLAQALGLFGKKKPATVKKTFARVFYSTAGAYPGFENESIDASMVKDGAVAADVAKNIATKDPKDPNAQMTLYTSKDIDIAKISSTMTAMGPAVGIGSAPLPPPNVKIGASMKPLDDKNSQTTTDSATDITTLTTDTITSPVYSETIPAISPQTGVLTNYTQMWTSLGSVASISTAKNQSTSTTESSTTVDAALAAQKFTNPLSPYDFPLSPATFEANTSEQFAGHVGPAAQFEIATFIGKLLVMPSYVGSFNATSQENSSEGWFILPGRIRSYGESNNFLSNLIYPRFQGLIDLWYGYQGTDGTYLSIDNNERKYGVDARDTWNRVVEVTW